ncbi:lysylphosphatidylglycerol synthase transmembrane domain-containing protein [Deinococcus yavapaiensis]|uniref:Uncharacterized protein (TIRG00374 family) n=1 Tax=Deinococcus yavapaiensis KR-236 TaxID=694435 RepID=A0A318S6L7_9DEIO|nr:lysylphosphatidylglycerol synthase transmembrane domain-containing protein [Deinococcus yavapaiensis]PYE54533.1 uncharacterized protein (TIRG00374 family) [Deinococcus yavapaiensis KR-236]
MPRRSRVRLDLLLHAVVLIGVAWAALTFVRAGDVAAALSRLQPALVLLVLGLGVLYTVFRSFIFAVVTRGVSDLPTALVMRAYLSAEATALLPGGVAARTALLNQLGVPVSRGLVPVLAVSILDQVFFGLVLIVAVVILPDARSAAWLLPVLVLLLVLLSVPAARNFVGRLVQPLLARFGARDGWAHFEEALRGTLRPSRLAFAFLLTVLAFTLKVFVLSLCLREVGVQLPPSLLLFAFVLPTLAGRLTPTPGGAGVTEAGMVAFLATFGGVAVEDGLVATLLFRAATVFVPALLGGVLYGAAWRGSKHLERT